MLTTVPLASVAQIRDLERRAIAALDGDGFALMQRAALAAWKHARIHFPAARRWLVCCGTGNNGGDGYLFARHAALAGVRVSVVRTGAPATPDATRAADACSVAGVPIRDFESFEPAIADLVIDAILGIGLGDAPRGHAASLIDAINAHGAPVFALDVPSGLDADLGSTAGSCVNATRTLTFIAQKPGLWTGAGRRVAGSVALVDLDAGVIADGDAESTTLLCGTAADALTARPIDDHKGRRGRVLLIGGDHGMGGAIALAGEACARVGAGVTVIVTRREHVAALLARRPELLVFGEDESNVELSQPVAATLARADVVAIGPGLAQGAWGRRWMERVIGVEAPRVFDADALNLLSVDRVRLRANDVITPHPGEAARLLGCTTADVERDRAGAARGLVAAFGATTVLKGAGTLIADPSGRLAVSPHAVPALATGGSGDVLTGLIAGMLAQGLDAWDAACTAVLAHAECGLRASALHGARGVLAGDLAAQLPAVLNR